MVRVNKSILFLLLIVAWTHVQCQSAKDIRRIEYTTLTRGYQKHVIITPDSIIKTVEGRQQEADRPFERRIDTGEWQRLIKYLKGLTLTELPELKSPTMARTYDGARHSSLTLLTNDGQSFSHSFDDEDPHAKLEPLMKAIMEMASSY